MLLFFVISPYKLLKPFSTCKAKTTTKTYFSFNCVHFRLQQQRFVHTSPTADIKVTTCILRVSLFILVVVDNKSLWINFISYHNFFFNFYLKHPFNKGASFYVLDSLFCYLFLFRYKNLTKWLKSTVISFKRRNFLTYSSFLIQKHDFIPNFMLNFLL